MTKNRHIKGPFTSVFDGDSWDLMETLLIKLRFEKNIPSTETPLNIFLD